jgi:hypothetical protein
MGEGCFGCDGVAIIVFIQIALEIGLRQGYVGGNPRTGNAEGDLSGPA